MKKLTTIIIIVLAAGLLVSFFVIRHYARKADAAMARSNKTQQAVKQAAEIINRYVDTAGRKHAVISAASGQLQANWYKNGTAISGGLVDTVAQALQIARKQLQEVTQIASVNQASALKAQRKFDSLQRLTYFYKDRYLQLAYRPATNDKDTSDHGQFDYRYNDSINVVQYWKRNWFLGAKKSYIDIFSYDPRTTINGVKRLTVKQNEPTFGLRLQAVSTYSFSRKLLNVGPGVQFDIKRFSLIYSHYYDFDARRFRPSVGARYDFVRF